LVKLCSVALAKVDDFNSQEIANTLNALSKFEYYHEKLVEALCLVALAKGNDFNSQGIANTLNALATFAYYDEQLTKALCSVALPLVKDFSSQHITNTFHALVVFEHYDEVLMKALLGEMSMLSPSTWTLEALSQIHAVWLALVHERPNLSSLFPPQLLQYASETYMELVNKTVKSSKLHLDVSNTLNLLNVQHVNEVIVGGFSVDMLIENMGVQVLVEVNGPSHYLKGARGYASRLKGMDVFKQRLLKRQGYKLLIVPYLKWNPMTGTKQKELYLKEMLGVS